MKHRVFSSHVEGFVLSKPAQHHLNILSHIRLIIGSDYHIAPAEIQVIIEQNRYRLWRKRFFYLTIISVYFLNMSRKSRRQKHYFVPFFKNSTCHPTCISTIIMIIIIIGSKNMLNRKSTIYEIMITCDVYIFQII